MPSFILMQNLMYKTSHSRRLLNTSPMTTMATPPQPSYQSLSSLKPKDINTFDTNVVMVLSVLLCALICSLGINSVIRCTLRCSTFVTSSTNTTGDATASSARLANKGVKKKELKMFPVMDYTPNLEILGLDTECVICLSDFAPGERVKVLPKCHHGFHVRCIDKWLNSHSSCPTCRHCLTETCNKIVGCSQPAIASTSMAVPAPAPAPAPVPAREQEVVIRIEPLQREGLIGNRDS